jgi:hypothetical protein
MVIALQKSRSQNLSPFLANVNLAQCYSLVIGLGAQFRGSPEYLSIAQNVV